MYVYISFVLMIQDILHTGHDYPGVNLKKLLQV